MKGFAAALVVASWLWYTRPASKDSPRRVPSVCIVVPFRDKPDDPFAQGKGRAQNLHDWIEHMCTFLPRVGHTNAMVRIIEQNAAHTFNKGALFNIGFLSELDAPCFVFHDVDQVPERATNTYTCRDKPTHMVVRTSQFGYKNVHQGSVGGALSMTRDWFQRVNGFSTKFWGWGGEDDNMRHRIGDSNLDKLDPNIGVYRALDHPRQRGLDTTHVYRHHPANDLGQSGLNTTHFSFITQHDWSSKCGTKGGVTIHHMLVELR